MGAACIGIAGGSGSGKTTLAVGLHRRLGEQRAILLYQDSYYRDQSALTQEARAAVNYDHPQSFDTELLVEHLDRLKSLEAVPRLRYDYVNHCRIEEQGLIEPRPIVIVEGILTLEDARMRERFDMKLYVDTDSDLRLLRRVKRDFQERGRSLDMVERQYLATVRPMHLRFVEPSKRFADLVIPEGGTNEVAVETVLARLEHYLPESE